MYFHDITVFKSDEDIPQLMDESERYNVDVIVSAAPQVMRINPDFSILEPILRKRIKRILDIMDEIDHDVFKANVKERMERVICVAYNDGWLEATRLDWLINNRKELRESL